MAKGQGGAGELLGWCAFLSLIAILPIPVATGVVRIPQSNRNPPNSRRYKPVCWVLSVIAMGALDVANQIMPYEQ